MRDVPVINEWTQPKLINFGKYVDFVDSNHKCVMVDNSPLHCIDLRPFRTCKVKEGRYSQQDSLSNPLVRITGGTRIADKEILLKLEDINPTSEKFTFFLPEVCLTEMRYCITKLCTKIFNVMLRMRVSPSFL